MNWVDLIAAHPYLAFFTIVFVAAFVCNVFETAFKALGGAYQSSDHDADSSPEE